MSPFFGGWNEVENAEADWLTPAGGGGAVVGSWAGSDGDEDIFEQDWILETFVRRTSWILR